MSRSLSWPSGRFLQSSGLWMLTCFCVVSSAVPRTGVAEEVDLKKLTGLNPVPRPQMAQRISWRSGWGAPCKSLNFLIGINPTLSRVGGPRAKG